MAMGWLDLLIAGVLAMVALGYVVLAWRLRHQARPWSRWRTAAFVTGAGIVICGLLTPLVPLPAGSFAAHMYQHLLIGMYGPLSLALGAPITLILRSVPAHKGRVIARALASRPVGVLSHPVTALILNVGGLYVLYLTPLYRAAAESPWLHHAIHLHFLLAGYLWSCAIAGADPAPHRPSVPARLVLLGVAIAAHAALAQLLYAGVFVPTTGAGPDVRSGAELMYYAGDIAELLLAFAMVTTWRPARQPTAGPRRVPLSPAREHSEPHA